MSIGLVCLFVYCFRDRLTCMIIGVWGTFPRVAGFEVRNLKLQVRQSYKTMQQLQD